MVTAVPSPLAGTLSFGAALSHVTVNGSLYPDGWRTWSHGYNSDVYYTGETSTSLTMTLPALTTGFYFYTEPRSFGVFTFTITTSGGDTFVTTGGVGIEGDSGAKGFGFYAPDTTITSIAVTVQPPVGVVDARGFAVGEFGIATIP